MPLAHLLGRVDALAPERRRHPHVGDEHLWFRCGTAGYHPVVVGCHPHDTQVGVALDERANSLPDDQVIVREEDVDGAAAVP